MKNIFLIAILLMTINTMAQKDTIYFNQHWSKVSKEKAKYYRLLPLEKKGDLYVIKDYFINGNVQMEGQYSDVKNETFEGTVKWYFKDGTLEETAQFKKGLRQGEGKTYIENGSLKTNGIYKNDQKFSGTFPAYCSDCDVELFENGKKTATYRYYKNTNKIAEKSTEQDKDGNYENFFYDRNGKEIAHVTMQFYQKPINGKMIYFNTDTDRKITIIENYANYKDGLLQGEAVNYNDKGEILAKGIYKDDKPFNGSFTNYIDNSIRTYKDGILEGDELFYSDKWKFVAKGINKNNKRWSGQFYDVYYNNFKTIVNYKDGKLAGKQVSYYTTYFEKIAEISYIENGEKSKVICYNKDGEEIAKGFYKDDKQWDGSFYDFYYHTLTSYKEGKKHGKYIQYSTKGKILSQQEYKDGKLEGNIISTGYFDDKQCNCIYKKGEPYKGEVCNDNFVITYNKGFISKKTEYDGDNLQQIKSIIEYKDEKPTKETHFVKGKKYVLTYKDNKSYEGVQYNSYNDAFYTFKKGVLDGAFSMSLGYSGIVVSGNYKNDKYHGIIKYQDPNNDKTTTCTYDKGKPINGTVLTEFGEKKYKDSLQYGKVFEFKEVYLYKNGERKFIYNAIEKEYKNGKTEGKVIYFLGDKIVNTNTYKDGKPYEGTFYKDEKYTLKYTNGDLQTITYNPHPYTVAEYYTNNKITKVEAIRDDNKYVGYYHLEEKYNGVFLNFDNDRFPLFYTLINYKDGLKNGLEKRFAIADDDKNNKEDLISTKTYKNGKLTQEIWHKYHVTKDEAIVGKYKNEKPYEGHFYAIENNTFNIFHFKEGKKEGKQFSGYVKKLAFIKTDSISYKNGKPFQGKKISYKDDLKFVQQYKNGKAIKTEILETYGEAVKAIVTYSDKGIDVKTPSGKRLCEVIYLDNTKEKAQVIAYKDFKKVGTLTYNKNKITKINLAFKEAGLDLKYDIDQQGKVIINVKNTKYSIIVHPYLEQEENFDFIDFLNIENLFMNLDSDATFYLDKIKKPISKCTIKKGKPYNGTIIKYSQNSKKYLYKTYKNGERIKKEKKLTKKELIKVLR